MFLNFLRMTYVKGQGKEKDRQIRKDNPIESPESLMYKDVTSKNQTGISYILCGKIYHFHDKNSWEKGHYYCKIMDWIHGIWFKCNESDVIKESNTKNSSLKDERNLCLMVYVKIYFFKKIK